MSCGHLAPQTRSLGPWNPGRQEPPIVLQPSSMQAPAFPESPPQEGLEHWPQAQHLSEPEFTRAWRCTRHTIVLNPSLLNEGREVLGGDRGALG